MIQPDKKLHALAGCAVAGFSMAFGLDWSAAVGLSLLAGVAKEVYDKQYGGDVSKADVAATLIGGLLGTGLVLMLRYVIG